ncbi:transmembrane protein 53-B [Culex pipiens pallens]|uniref:transmembrane protein 53-B n=1 Tax=Culex pipiens pallens TaxID=42434 RepID=UPI00195316DD|nr:transmembrane protein 53-B [Culex pipiens pallens]
MSSGGAAYSRVDDYPMDDSLEYFIKFPSPNFKTDTQDAESDYVFVCNETNVPIVLLLGWAGCQDRYLMKYSKIYEDRGLITIRYTAPVENLFWKRSGMDQIGEKILKLIYDMNFDSHPLIFHVFSNGGAFLYQHIALSNRKSKNPVQICGMIFDSAPGDRRILGLSRAITAIFGKERYCNSLFSALLTISIIFLWTLEDVFNYVWNFIRPSGYEVQTNPSHNLKFESNAWPQLFLYSREDRLIPYTDIEKFASYRRKVGVDVRMVCFERSEHVKHYIRHPQQYVYSVCKFINDCLTTHYNKYHD